VARCLIVGCGCRGRQLAVQLRARGHVVRGTTRRSSGRAAIEAVGAEAVLADPDRIATLAPALEHVSVACVLLGGARGSDAALAALHGPRLEMLLARIIDTTVRGVVYEAAGSVDGGLLRAGAALVATACGRSMIPFALVELDAAAGYAAWTDAALACVAQVIG
jgi:uncharacterized protein YbjT (DUF2867 family)